MIFFEGNMVVDNRDICYNCNNCYNCNIQYDISKKLQDTYKNVYINYKFNSCTKYIPIEVTRPTEGTINDIIKWREGG